MITILPVQSDAEIEAAEEIRMNSFDRGDLVRLSLLRDLMEQGKGCYNLIREQQDIVGLLYTRPFEQVTYILYLAIRPDRRSSGIGSAVLSQFLAQCPTPVMLDQESVLETNAADYPQRLRRDAFYRRNGFHVTPHTLRDCGGMYDILTSDGREYLDEFFQALKDFDFLRYHPELLDNKTPELSD